jgi:hypothetical protein
MRLHQQILTADPALDLPASAVGGAPVTVTRQRDGAIVARQLPAGMSHFIGRAAELDALSGMLSDASGSGCGPQAASGMRERSA